jgi:hypothetical protein
MDVLHVNIFFVLISERVRGIFQLFLMVILVLLLYRSAVTICVCDAKYWLIFPSSDTEKGGWGRRSISSCNPHNIGVFFNPPSLAFENLEQNMLWEAVDFLIRPE